jgi:hypothetical protein
MLRNRTSFNDYAEIQQTLDRLTQLQMEHRDLYVGARLSPLGEEYATRYEMLKRQGKLSTRAPQLFTWPEALGFGIAGLLAGITIPLASTLLSGLLALVR